MNRDIRYFDRFSVADPGAWFRILPIGQFQRFGRKVSITPSEIAEMKANFDGGVPETGAPVTTAHKSEAGKVGDVAELAVHEDGLYAHINWLETGLKLLAAGAFQFFSPEIMWGQLEHEGRTIQNILMGLSLVNDPFFGKATALFSAFSDGDRVDNYREFAPDQRRQLAKEGKAMPDGSYPIENAGDLENAVSAWGRSPDEPTKRHIIKRAKDLGKMDMLPADWPGSTKEKMSMDETKKTMMDAVGETLEKFGIMPKPAPGAVPVTETVEYKALQTENKRLADERAEAEKKTRIATATQTYASGLKVEGWEAPAEIPANLAVLAEADKPAADALATQFKALAEQAKAGKLFAELGSGATETDPGGSPVEKFTALVTAKAAELKIDVADAQAIVAKEQPKLYEAFRRKSARRADED